MKVIPIPSELTAPYWDAAANHVLAIQRCACGRLSHPPVARCPKCFGSDFTWPAASGLGTVHAFTIVHHSVHPVTIGSTPYVIALIELDEGPRVVTNIRNCPPEKVRIGMPVEVVFEELDGSIALPQFEPRSGGAS
ncbi:MAG: Zn-ribbon domain-containing OB-fold protein [Acidimicrobiales bacterium]